MKLGEGFTSPASRSSGALPASPKACFFSLGKGPKNSAHAKDRVPHSDMGTIRTETRDRSSKDRNIGAIDQQNTTEAEKKADKDYESKLYVISVNKRI